MSFWALKSSKISLISPILSEGTISPTGCYTQDGNKLDFLRNKNHLFKPQRGDINIAWGSAPGNPSYDHVEYRKVFIGNWSLVIGHWSLW
jgi:hypothetical protein